ncbi:MAG: hypothetical protein LBH14_07325 [Desulfobulbaceae bacterium]|jgi:hypothetical protein|nr:hypothetical protein [Desulfobulbaceae bacterium]
MNPEFKRNLWLEISPAHLVLMPTLIVLVALLVTVSSPLSSAETALFYLSVYGFIAITILWGFFQAGNSLSQEFIEGTWDSQRLSALTPWQMIWGKLFGGTIYAWYGGVILLAIAGFCALQLEHSLTEALIKGIGLICVALIVHISALLPILLARRKRSGSNSRVGLVGLCVLLLLVIFSFHGLPESLTTSSPLLWWGYNCNPLNFTVATLVFLAIWGLIGLWETMRRELMLPNRLWGWPLFLLFWLTWSAGFVQGRESWPSFFAGASIAIGLSGYLLLFTVRKDQGMWLRLIAANRSKRLPRHLELGWLVSLVIAVGLGIVAVLLSSDVIPNLIIFLCCCAFVARDIAWIFWLHLVVSNSSRAEGAAVVSLAVAYGLLPLLFRFGGHLSLFIPPLSHSIPVTALAAATTGGFAIHGSIDSTSLITLASALIQAALCVWLFYLRWRSLFFPSEKARAAGI